jgi:GNAT superfamily N-acetyltransferase
MANALVLEIEKVERDAYGDLYEAAPAHVRAALGVETRAIGQTRLLLCPGVDNLQFNRLCGLGVFEPAQGAEIDQAVRAFERAGVKDWVIQFAEGAEGVEYAASSHNLKPHRRTWAKFARDDAPAQIAATDLSIREIGSEDAPAFGQTAAKSFNLPEIVGDWLSALPGRKNWRCYAAFYGTEPVAAGALYTDGPNAWIGAGATLEAHRGRGAQPALLSLRIEAARQAGCTILTTETSIPHPGEPAPSFRNITRAGFLLAYPRPNLARAQD